MQGCGADPAALHAVDFLVSLEGGVCFDLECLGCLKYAGKSAGTASDNTGDSFSSDSSESGR